MLATDVNKTQDRSVKLHVGTEWKYNPNLLLRVGINESEVTAGLGIKIGRVGVDYAFGFQDAVGGVEDLGSSHRFGFNFHFGGKVSDQEVSLRWQKKGQIALADLRAKMSEENPSHDDKLQKALTSAKQVIRHQGYLRPQDLYAAQGYISFFEGQFERSVQSLGEAAVLDADNLQLKDHLEFARAQMAEGRSREIVSYELKRVKDMYEKGDWKGTVKSCEKILSFRPDHADAFVYLEDAKARINEPIQREMKIAKMKFEKQEYLDAIKSFQKVKEMDPENKEAAQYISFSIAALEKQAQVQSSMAVNSIRPVYEIERNSDKSRELYSKGLLLYSQGKMQEASAVWAQAVKYDDTNVLARNAYNRSQIELKEQAQ
jgi:tetratricopeptide (TPR) repeat protein